MAASGARPPSAPDAPTRLSSLASLHATRQAATLSDAYVASSAPPVAALLSSVNNNIHSLCRAWVAEKATPDLLRYEAALVAACGGALATAVAGLPSALTTRSAAMGPVLRLDVDRLRFLLSAYHGVRWVKLQKWAPWLARQVAVGEVGGDDDEEEEDGEEGGGGAGRAALKHTEPRLSPLEAKFVTRYASLRAAHVEACVLSSLPRRYRRTEPGEAEDDIDGLLQGPPTQRMVFGVTTSDVEFGEVSPPDGTGMQGNDFPAGSRMMLALSEARPLYEAGRLDIF